jgi:hypothetical protein
MMRKFMDVWIHHNTGVAGYALPFSCHMHGPEGGQQFFYADTLAGIKDIIRRNKKKGFE